MNYLNKLKLEKNFNLICAFVLIMLLCYFLMNNKEMFAGNVPQGDPVALQSVAAGAPDSGKDESPADICEAPLDPTMKLDCMINRVENILTGLNIQNELVEQNKKKKNNKNEYKFFKSCRPINQ